jgi:uncharacterized UPF0146 family protein
VLPARQEAEKLIKGKRIKQLKGAGAHVLVIGATAGVINALRERGFEVSATDLSPAVVGTELGRVRVHDARVSNDALMKTADVAIITGMSLPNGTLPRLMRLAQQYDTSTILWAVTGRNFGRYYIEHGVDCVVSDPSPFLLLPGPARLGSRATEGEVDEARYTRPVEKLAADGFDDRARSRHARLR